MIEVNKKTTERAILITLKTRDISLEIVTEHLDELEELALTAGAIAIKKIIQTKSAIDPAFYVGRGKAQEMVQMVEEYSIDLIIFDDELSPVQIRNLEKLLNRKIVDRSALILDIFASRAKTKEAKTQVELAQLEYLLPRLTRAWTHLSKQYGGIRTKGPGETQIESDRRIIRNKIAHLKENLKKIEAQRNERTKGRGDFIRICLVGYTNVGKSTLFNKLTEANVFAEDKLFATLDSTTRIFNHNKSRSERSSGKILLSDTVGFIRKLPADLVASFKSTLNEVRDADIILHVIDVSHPYYEDQITVVEDTLKDLNCEKKTIIKVFNKIDAVEDRQKLNYVMNKYKGGILISAEKGINVSKLIDHIFELAENSYVEERVDLDLEDSKTAAKIHSMAEVLSTKYDDEQIHIIYRTNRSNSDKIKKMVGGE